jgi:hypothetical protein
VICPICRSRGTRAGTEAVGSKAKLDVIVVDQAEKITETADGE